MNISKKRDVTDWLFISLMSWYPISGLFNILFPNTNDNNIYLILSLLFLLVTISDFRQTRTLKRVFVVLMVWSIYLILYYYHTQYEPAVSLRIMKEYLTVAKTISHKTFFFVGLAVYVYRNKYRLNLVFQKLLLLGTCMSFILMAVVFFTQGLSFFLEEAVKVEKTSVTLITMSYNFVLYATLAIHLICKKEGASKTAAWICLIICVISILFMGKRGPLLSIIGVYGSLYLFANKTWQKSLLYSSIIVLLYFVIISNINYLFDLMSIFSQRLADQSKLVYYYGDTNGRDVLWEAAIKQISHGPWFGYYPKLIFVDTMSFAWGMHPHNIFLESLMTMGIIGSIPFFLLLVYTLLIKAYPFIVIDGAYRFFGLLLISELIHNCFSGTLYTSWVWPILFVFSFVSVKDKRLWEIHTSYK